VTRLDVALIARHPELSRRKAREVIEKGQVSVDGHLVRAAGSEVGDGARIDWDVNRRALPRARASLPLLWSDDALVVVDKPAGLLAVPTATGVDEDTVLGRVQDYARHLHPHAPFVGVVHRLDRDTSGALVFAFTPPAREGLRALFRSHRIERRYVALVEGRPRADQGTIDRAIHEGYESGRRRLTRVGETGRPALTRWRVLERFAAASLLEIELETGRQHQIRLHLAHVGLPVLGEPVYADRAPGRLGGSRRRPPVPARRQMLHARVLGFTHPLTGAALRVESPLPPEFQQVLQRLRRTRAPER
jgi:23S rRNA pseudouridine1911/1915/1917 synthase